MDAYKLLAERHGFGTSEKYPKILQFLMTPKQAEIVTYLPAPFEEVAQKAGLTLEEVKKEIDDLFKKGVVIPKDFYTREGARFCRDVTQLHDATQGDQKIEGDIWRKSPFALGVMGGFLPKRTLSYHCLCIC